MVQPARARGHVQPLQRTGWLGPPAAAAGRALHEVLLLVCCLHALYGLAQPCSWPTTTIPAPLLLGMAT